MVLLNVLLGAGAGLHQRHGSQRLASANQARNHGPNGCGMRRHATCNSKGSKHVQTCNSEGSIWKQNEANAMKQKLLEPGKNTLCDFSVPTCRVPDLRKRSRCDSNPMFSSPSCQWMGIGSSSICSALTGPCCVDLSAMNLFESGGCS